MRTVLYLVTKNEEDATPSLIAQDFPENLTTSAVLLQEAVSLSNVQANRVCALTEDAVSKKVTPSAPTVSYRDLLHMIFDADVVVAL